MAIFAGLGANGGLIAGGVAASAVVAVVAAVVVFQPGGEAPPVVGATPVMGSAPDGVVVPAREIADTPGAGRAGSDTQANGAPQVATALPEGGPATGGSPAGNRATGNQAAGDADIRLGGGQDINRSATVIGNTVVASVDPGAATGDAPRISTAPATAPAAKQAVTGIGAAQKPRFDLVRVDKSGSALVAGKARPGNKVDIYLDGKVVAVVEADPRGAFVAMFDVPPSTTQSVITLAERDVNGVLTTSPDQVMVIAPETPRAAKVQSATVQSATVQSGAPVAANTPNGATNSATDTPQVAAASTSGAVPQNAATPAKAQAAVAGDVKAADTRAAPTAMATTPPRNSVAGGVIPDDATTIEVPAGDTLASRSTAQPATQPVVGSAIEASPQAIPAAGTAQKTASQAAKQNPAAGTRPATPLARPSDEAVARADVSPRLPVSRAPAVIIANDKGVRVLQPPAIADNAPEVMANVSLDLISYDERGEVVLSGRSKVDRHVRVYVNDRPVKTGAVGKDGTWRLSLPEVEAGRYTLRVDELDAAGKVTSRLETPFQKEKPEKVRLANAAATDTLLGVRPRLQKVTIQRGNTLWALAEQNYGEGVLYMQIFNANRDRIRNPDLIYPGQIFTIPE